jgi:hypothetical protein
MGRWEQSGGRVIQKTGVKNATETAINFRTWVSSNVPTEDMKYTDDDGQKQVFDAQLTGFSEDGLVQFYVRAGRLYKADQRATASQASNTPSLADDESVVNDSDSDDEGGPVRSGSGARGRRGGGTRGSKTGRGMSRGLGAGAGSKRRRAQDDEEEDQIEEDQDEEYQDEEDDASDSAPKSKKSKTSAN